MDVYLIVKKVLKLSTMPGLKEAVCVFFDHCIFGFDTVHHFGGCGVSEFMGVPAFSCPGISDSCVYVEPCPVGLYVDIGGGNEQFYYLSAITKEKSKVRIIGLYVNYQPLSRDYVKETGSYFFSESWLEEAQSQSFDKTVIVPTNFVLDPELINPHASQQLIDLGFKFFGTYFGGGDNFPAVVWSEGMYGP